MHELCNQSDFTISNYLIHTNLTFNEEIETTNFTTVKDKTSRWESVSFIVGIQSCFGILPNIAVLLLLFHRKRRNRALQYLNAHLAIISILILCQGMMYLADDKHHSESEWCSGVVYIRNCLINLLALTILCISHERVQGLEARHHHGRLGHLGSRSLGNVKMMQIGMGIWIFSLVAAAPTFFSARFMQHTHLDGELHSACVKGPVLGNYVLGLVYEAIRCLLFHILLCCYLIFELYKIRAKLKYFYFLQPIPSRRLKKVRRVRFIFLNSVIFVLIWAPFGLLHSIYTTIRDKDKILHFEENPVEEDDKWRANSPSSELSPKSCNRHPTPYYIGICVIYWYIILLPVILYWTHHNDNICKSLDHFLRKFPCRKNRQCQSKSAVVEYSRDQGVTVARSSFANGDNGGCSINEHLRGSEIQIIIDLVDDDDDAGTAVSHV